MMRVIEFLICNKYTLYGAIEADAAGVNGVVAVEDAMRTMSAADTAVHDTAFVALL